MRVTERLNGQSYGDTNGEGLIPKGNAMSAQLLSSLKARLLGAAVAAALSFGVLTAAHAGPVLAQTDAPNLGASRATEVLPTAPQTVAQPANIGNPTAAAGAEKRVALVIGNSAYENVTPLPNPANDA